MPASARAVLAAILAAALSTPLISGCTSTPGSMKVAVAAAAPREGGRGGDLRLAGPVNRFGFELLAKAAESDGDSAATVVSPVSVAAALSMAMNGTKGATEVEMRSAMHLDELDETSANDAWANVLSSLSEEGSSSLRVANSLWADSGIPFNDAFLETDRDYFGAEIRTLDLQAPDTADTINGWVSEQTEGRITDLVQEVDGNAALELLNAVYFTSRWKAPFDESQTRDLDFTLPDNTKVKTPVMERSGDMAYLQQEDGTQIVRMEYEGGQSMYVLLPAKNDSADRLVSSFGKSVPDFTGLRIRQGRLELPRFETRSRFSLANELKALGIRRAFDSETADFGKMANVDGLYIGKVAHQTFVKTDEEGSEAAAATQVEMALAGVAVAPPDEPPFEMRVDRPFAFVITDEESGLVLFAGVVRDPRSGQ